MSGCTSTNTRYCCPSCSFCGYFLRVTIYRDATSASRLVCTAVGISHIHSSLYKNIPFQITVSILGVLLLLFGCIVIPPVLFGYAQFIPTAIMTITATLASYCSGRVLKNRSKRPSFAIGILFTLSILPVMVFCFRWPIVIVVWMVSIFCGYTVFQIAQQLLLVKK